tara:strand:+ start:23550 stop:23885 length:336 start_codon:yes stop_codon:yes gene_type:complete
MIENTKEVKEKMEVEGYKNITYVKGKGWCGVKAFMFTIGLCCGIEQVSYDHRYCYEHKDAMIPLLQLVAWGNSEEDVTEDPDDPYWIKKKGSEEYSNHRHNDFDERFDSKK